MTWGTIQNSNFQMYETIESFQLSAVSHQLLGTEIALRPLAARNYGEDNDKSSVFSF